jgi:hypothetical protein
MLEFKSNTPCNNCPYRKDAPVKHWHKSEFERLSQNDSQQFAPVYGCHKKNNSVCVGWLMNQDERGLPSIPLRLQLMKQKITRKFLDGLHCESERFETIEEMVKANT